MDRAASALRPLRAVWAAAPLRGLLGAGALALLLLVAAPGAWAQLSDDARTSTQGTQFVRPAPRAEPTPPPPPPPAKAPEPEPMPAAAVEPPKPPPPPVDPPRYPSVVFLVDTSDSMLNRVKAGEERTKLDDAKSALIQVLQDMAPNARVQVWTFNTRMHPVPVPGVAPGSFVEIGRGKRRSQLMERVRAFNTAGGTNLYLSIVKALDLFSNPRDQQAYRSGLRYPVLVVLSDGEDGGKTRETLQSVQAAKARQAHVTVNAIGFNLGEDRAWFKVLCEVATRPDGCATADDEAQLRRLLESFYRFRN